MQDGHKVDAVYASDSEKLHRGYRDLVQSGRWLDHPMIVTIETYSKCNARCDFCPYVQLDRIGTALPKERVFSLLDEISSFEVAPARLNLSRVNEPFLDRHLFLYLRHAASVLPETDLILFTNGQPVTDAVIDQLNSIPTFRRMSISFNEHDPATYREVMGIDQRQTLKRLDRLHERKSEGDVRFDVSLGRVGASTATDDEFLAFCKARFPLFQASVSARFDWIGTGTGAVSEAAPDAGCNQWFSLHVLADGQTAFCCIDGGGIASGKAVDASSLLDIYNLPMKRALRSSVTSRRDVRGCSSCIHGMSAAAYVKAG